MEYLKIEIVQLSNCPRFLANGTGIHHKRNDGQERCKEQYRRTDDRRREVNNDW